MGEVLGRPVRAAVGGNLDASEVAVALIAKNGGVKNSVFGESAELGAEGEGDGVDEKAQKENGNNICGHDGFLLVVLSGSPRRREKEP